ncbi:MAG: hypothetical protein AAFP86_11425 [Planctomycetota bacterium]
MRIRFVLLLAALLPGLLVSQGVSAEICRGGSLVEQVADLVVGGDCCGAESTSAGCCGAPADHRTCCGGGAPEVPDGPYVDAAADCGCCATVALDPVELVFDGDEDPRLVGAGAPSAPDAAARPAPTVARVGARSIGTERAPPPGVIVPPGLRPGVRPLRI